MTNKIKEIVYGLGGFDESKENNNIVEIIYFTDSELKQIAAQEAKAKAKADLLDRLGITEEEVKLLLG